MGSIGAAGAFSLNATKILSGGEGGLLTTNSTNIFNLSAMTHVFSTEIVDGELRYRGPNSLGLNYRTNEFTSAFALGRFTSFEEERAQRIAHAVLLIDRLKAFPGIVPPVCTTDGSHVYSMLRIRLNPAAMSIDMPARLFREKVAKAMVAEGMDWWIWERRALPDYPVFQIAIDTGFPFRAQEFMSFDRKPNAHKHFPMAAALADDALFTSVHFPGNGDLIDAYLCGIEKIWNHIDEIIELPVDSIPSEYQIPF